MSNNIYIGNGEKKSDTWFKSSICLSNIPEDCIFDYKGKRYIRVDINVKDQKDQFGKDVSIKVDTWKPDNTTADNQDQDDIPF